MTGIPGKTGVVYTLDRETGEFLWANPTVAQNVITHIDGATGDVTENPEVLFSALGQERLACPSWAGGKDWEAGAYSPLTHTMYFPLRNACQRLLSTTEGGSSTYMPRSPPPARPRHRPARHRPRHRRRHRRHPLAPRAARGHHGRSSPPAAACSSGATRTAASARSTRTPARCCGRSTSARRSAATPSHSRVDGRQYVAVGTGTSANASINLRMTPELRPSFGNNLFVFALP